jgi:hypothetical protein
MSRRSSVAKSSRGSHRETTSILLRGQFTFIIAWAAVMLPLGQLTVFVFPTEKSEPDEVVQSTATKLWKVRNAVVVMLAVIDEAVLFFGIVALSVAELIGLTDEWTVSESGVVETPDALITDVAPVCAIAGSAPAAAETAPMMLNANAKALFIVNSPWLDVSNDVRCCIWRNRKW